MNQMSGQFRAPSVTMNLLIINALLFAATSMLPGGRGQALMLQLSIYMPSSPHFELYQFVTHMFIHADMWHLFFNMFALWMFGRIVEYDLGSKRFLIYYFFCGIGAALLQLGVNWFEISALENAGQASLAARAMNIPMMGASGAVFGLLLAFGMIRPNSRIMLLLPPIPMKAKYFVIIFGLLEIFFGIRSGGGGGVAHFAHVGGMLWGLPLLLWWRKRGKIYFYK